MGKCQEEKDIITEQFRLKMAREAEMHNCFVVFNRKWYTPDEFRAAKGIYGETKDVKIIDPLGGIDAMREKLNRLENEFAEFTKKVAAYYRERKR